MKKLLAVILSVVIILSCTAFSAFAVGASDTAVEAQETENTDLSEAYEKLDSLCCSAVYDYGLSLSDRDSKYKYEPGVLVIDLTNESFGKGCKALGETEDFLDNYTIDPEGYTLTDFDNQYAKLKNTLDSLVISKSELKSLISFCAEEKNDTGYYSEELWGEFVNKLNDAKAVYDDKEIVEDYRVTQVYFELLHSHFTLCSSNTMFGDIDNDGKISIIDATHLQRMLAQLEEFNSSQKLVSKSDILYATLIQRYLAEFDVTLEIENSTLDDYLRYTGYSDIHSKDFKFESWKYDYLYMDYVIEDNYPLSNHPVYL